MTTICAFQTIKCGFPLQQCVPPGIVHVALAQGSVAKHVALAHGSVAKHVALAQGSVAKHVALAQGSVAKHVALAQGGVANHVALDKNLVNTPRFVLKSKRTDRREVNMQPVVSSLVSSLSNVIKDASKSFVDESTSSLHASVRRNIRKIDQFNPLNNRGNTAITFHEIESSSSTLPSGKTLCTPDQKRRDQRGFAFTKYIDGEEPKLPRIKNIIFPCPDIKHFRIYVEACIAEEVIGYKRHNTEAETSKDSTKIKKISKEERKRMHEREERLKTRNRLAARRYRKNENSRIEQL